MYETIYKIHQITLKTHKNEVHVFNHPHTHALFSKHGSGFSSQAGGLDAVLTKNMVLICIISSLC